MGQDSLIEKHGSTSRHIRVESQITAIKCIIGQFHPESQTPTLVSVYIFKIVESTVHASDAKQHLSFCHFSTSFPTAIFSLQGEAPSKHIYKIPLSNLVGRSIERPLKSPLVNKLVTAPTSSVIAPAPTISTTPSLSVSRMEIKEIASRTRKELLGKSDVCVPELKLIIT